MWMHQNNVEKMVVIKCTNVILYGHIPWVVLKVEQLHVVIDA